jgi:neutral trehalase
VAVGDAVVEVKRAAQSSATHLAACYSQNVTGFGWTNAVFLELLHESPAEVAAQLKKD